MKWGGEQLRKAYISTLNGSLTFNSVAVPIYDLQAPENANTPYVLLAAFNQQNTDTKDSFNGRCQLNIEVVTDYIKGGGRQDADRILNSLLELVNPSKGVVNLPNDNFKFASVEVAGSFDRFDEEDSQSTYRNVVILNHLFFQS